MGDPNSKLDSEGRQKVQCKECNKWYHRLDVHLKTKHGIDVKTYTDRYPGAPTISETAKKAAEASQKQKGVDLPPKDAVSSGDLFNFGAASVAMREDLKPDEVHFVPIHDEAWRPGEKEQEALEALAMGIQENQNVLIVGPAGVGKSTLARELAAIVNQPMRYIPINGEMRVDDLMGGDQLLVDSASGQSITKHQDGPLPEAAEAGHWVLLDEFDSIPSHVGFILHGALEADRKLTRHNGKPVKFHRHFRVIATANTLGYGDESGMYAGTAPMNRALLDRFAIIIQMDFPAYSDEVQILVSKSNIEEERAKKMVSVAQKVRESQANDTSSADLSPRRLIMWAQLSVRLGSVQKAAKFSILNRLAQDDRKFVEGLIQRYFG